MSKVKKNENKLKNKKPPVGAEEKKQNKLVSFISKNRKALMIGAVAVVLLAAFIVGLVAVIINQREFDYMKSDLSKYVTIKESDYKNYPVSIPFDTVDETDVQRAINKLLYDNRESTPLHDGALVLNQPLSVGDTVYIYYRGYTVDEDGNKTDLQNGCNFTDASEYQLGLGSGSFIYGFEDGLIGKIPKEYSTFKKITTGKADQGTVIYLSGSVMLPDGTSKTAFSAKRLDINDPKAEEAWGKDFVNYILGKPSSDGKENTVKDIGKKLDTATFKLGSGSAVYYDLTIDFVTNCETDPIVVETRFPIDYTTIDLRGKTVFFEVFPKGAILYDAPEYDDEFITKTLKLTEDDLKDYEGATLTERHTAKLKAELEEKLEDTKNGIIEEAMWNYFREKAVYKKLPEYAVRDYYAQYYNEIESLYPSYQSQYQTMDSFACAYYGLNSNADWRAYITDMAKSMVAEKLVFYYIVREEGITPTDAEFKDEYDSLVADHLEYYIDELYKEELEEITDDKSREERIAEIKEEMLDYYGEDYFTENTHYLYALDKLIGFAKVTEEK